MDHTLFGMSTYGCPAGSATGKNRAPVTSYGGAALPQRTSVAGEAERRQAC